jgi:hypothetical protein
LVERRDEQFVTFGGQVIAVDRADESEWPHQRGINRMNRVMAGISPSSVSY